MKTKTLDCVQMKRKGAESVQKKLDGKSLKEQLDFWKKGTTELKKLQKKTRDK